MAKILLLIFALVAVSLADEAYEQMLMQAIDESVARAKTQSQQPLEKVCYRDLGCFESNGPMRQTGVTPMAPEQIDTKFYAYTPASRAQPQLIDAYNPSTFSVVDPNKRTAIVIHGFGMDYSNEQLGDLKENLLDHTDDEIGTVILVDWSKGAASPDYLAASSNTQVVGRQVAHLVNELGVHRSVSPKSVYLLGFSLGAQVSGYAGKFAASEYGWKLGRITGLDAAAPLFEGYPGSHLTQDDADFVDGIHSSAGGNILLGEVGFVSPYAHLDFYPNGGKKQPHCGLFSGITCNHYGSVLFYDASLHANTKCQFNGVQCKNWDEFVAKKCSSPADVELGYWAHAQKKSKKNVVHAVGSRFLATTKKTPFCH